MFIPGSSKRVKLLPFHPKNLPKGINFTSLEDPGILYNSFGNPQVRELYRL